LRAGHFIPIAFPAIAIAKESTFNRMSQNGCKVKVRWRWRKADMNDGKSFSPFLLSLLLLMPIQLTEAQAPQ
jgi:hypothetical protein